MQRVFFRILIVHGKSQSVGVLCDAYMKIEFTPGTEIRSVGPIFPNTTDLVISRQVEAGHSQEGIAPMDLIAIAKLASEQDGTFLSVIMIHEHD